MRRLWLVLILGSVGCPGGDDAAASGGSSTSSGEGVEPESSGGPGPDSTETGPSDTGTGVDTTCGDACPGTSDGSSTSLDGGSSTTAGSSEDTSTSANESSGEGPTGTCGNGIVEGGEDCDDMVESATCDDDCTFVDCGDENVNQTAGEACDAGGESFSCDTDCTLPVCGDGLINASVNEVCDDAGESPDCDNNCTLVSCGDGTPNLAALETCDDGNNVSDDGCSGTCVLEGDFGGACRIVDGRQWCFNDDACGEACEDVCGVLGLTIEPDDAAWFAAQDSPAECQAISDAFGLGATIDFGDHPLGCLQDGGINDLVGGGLTGGLMCSSDPACPAAHRTDMDDLGLNCNLVGARRSVCPCAGEFCGNAVVEGVEECDDGNQINNDGCTSGCSLTPPSCMEVNGVLWCYDPDACGEACNDVCAALGMSLDISDAEWSAAQDTMEECQDIAEAFGLSMWSLGFYTYACAEEDGFDDIPNMGIQGILYCSNDPNCPFNHRTNADSLGLDCNIMGSFRGLCPCN
jgi:cysteine-rich repeat protein